MKTAILALGIFLGSIGAFAQKASLFKPLRYDEDWSKIKRDSSVGSYDKIKFIPLLSIKNFPICLWVERCAINTFTSKMKTGAMPHPTKMDFYSHVF
jgi:hypothetical protein